MGLFDKFRKKNSGLTIEEIISNDYEQEYFDECKYIWKNYVPSKGQADSLQGELLREMEKIRCEAQDNGNINWDDDYSYFCDFISERLCEQPIFTAAEKDEVILIMSYLKKCGIYAQKFNSGKIPENNVDIECVKDVRFRNKTAFEVSTQKSKEDYIRLSPVGVQDMYTYAFLNALDYTENCYKCRYASLDRVSDITLGDSWSSKLAKEEQNKGISLILCQTEKGKKLIQDTKLTLSAVDLKDAIAANHQLSHPSIEPVERKDFFDNLSKGFEHALFSSVPKIYLRKKIKTILLKAKILRGGRENN